MAKTSIKATARDAIREDAKLRKDAPPPTQGALDSFVNFAQKLGIGADSPLSTASYGFNPITRIRTLLEWIHRGSWLGGVAVDVVADDMTRMGIEYVTEMPPEDTGALDRLMMEMAVWPSINEVIKWGRLYGGCIGVLLIDGQDMRTPLKVEAVGKGAFRGIIALDRWMVEAVLEDLVTDLGPHLGMPKYYRIGSAAPALRGQSVHYTRVAFRHEGIRLPYQQRLTENLWGISVLERLYDRMVAYDSASTGAAQLIYKSYLRTLSIEGMREIVSSGGKALDALVKYTDMMRRFQGIEGITLIDAKDTFETQVHGAFSGISDALMQFAQQLSGALQIPLTRLFGQSPSGLNASGDNEMRNYYDHIKQRQEQDLHHGCSLVYRCGAMSEGITLPDDFAIGFRSLWQLTDMDKAGIGKTNADTVLAAKEAGLISNQTALRELRQASRTTGVFSNVTTELIEEADEDTAPPMGEHAFDPITGEQLAPVPMKKREKIDAGSQGKKGSMDPGKAGRKPVQQPASQRRAAS